MRTAREIGVMVAATAAGILVFGVLGGRFLQPPEVRGDDRARPIEWAIADVRPGDVVRVLPRDEIAAILDADTVAADETDLREEDRVIGVEVAGQARAYAVAVLSAHEIANDEAVGVPIAVTWCPLCSTAVVYDRRVGGRTLTFGVSGSLYRNSLVIYDRETSTLWSHVLGVGLVGPLAGTRLETIPSVVTSWGVWRREHPDTRVLSAGSAPYDPYEGYYRSPQTGIQRLRRRDTRLGSKERVLAVLAPSAKAYAFRDLESRGRIADTLAGRRVEVVYDREAASARAVAVGPSGRRPLPSTPIFWFAWVDLFPGAPLWRPPAGADDATGETGRRVRASHEE